MERDGFTCRHCESTTKTLNVHHTFYDKRFAPWEYPDHTLYTFCEDCHRSEEALKTNWDWRLIEAFRRMGATNAAIERMTLLMGEIEKECHGGSFALIEHVLSEAVGNGFMPPQKGETKPLETRP